MVNIKSNLKRYLYICKSFSPHASNLVSGCLNRKNNMLQNLFVMVNNKSNLQRYLYICKSFSARAILSTIKLILHKVLVNTKGLIETMVIT